MVTEGLLGAFFDLLTWLVSQLPTWTPPAWLGDIPGHVATLSGYVVSVSAWLPFTLLNDALLAVGVALLCALGIKVGRIAASFFTGGGGSAA